MFLVCAGVYVIGLRKLCKSKPTAAPCQTLYPYDPKSGSSTRRRKRFRCYPRQQRAGDFYNHIVQKRLPSVSFGQLLRNGFYMTQGLLNIVDECNQGVFCGVHGGQIHGSLAAMFDRSTNSGEQ